MYNKEWDAAKNILCIRLDALGDVLMTTPAIRALKQSDSERRVTLLTSSSGALVAASIPEIDDVIVYDPPWMKASKPASDSSAEYSMASDLRDLEFDAAVIFTVYTQSPLPAAFLCFLAGIPLRLAHCHENPYQLLTDWVPDPEPDKFIRHEVQRQLDLVATIGAHTDDLRLSLDCSSSQKSRMRRMLTENGIDLNRDWVLMHPGATAPSRRYPTNQFAEAALAISSKLDCQVVLVGSKQEQNLINDIERAMGTKSVSFAGSLSLSQLTALISIAPVLVSNNSGPAHIAAAVGTPVVDLYALTNPQHTPWEVPCRVLSYDVPCKYCYKSVCPHQHNECLSGVTPQAVADATAELLSLQHSRKISRNVVADTRHSNKNVNIIVPTVEQAANEVSPVSDSQLLKAGIC